MALGGLDARLLTVVIKAQNDTKAAFAEVGAQLEGLKHASGGGGFLGLAGPAGMAAAAGIAAITVAVGGAAIATKWASDFQTELTALVTGAGEAAKAIPAISKGILTMAGEVGQTPVNLAKGLFMIESAGYHGAGGLKVLQAAAEGAKVGNADMMVTADAVTTVMKDYHLGVNQAADATNFLIGVVKQGKTHMEDLAGSLSGILPIASSLHIPLEQVGGAMATLTARGVPAANAATYLRFTISALAGETPKGTKALKEIGLTSLEVGNTLTTQGLLPALQLIQEHLTKKFPQGGAAMFATLKDITGGTRGLGAALQLTGQNLDDFAAATKTVSDQMTGAQGKILGWNLVQKDFGFQMDRSKASVIAMGTQLGQHLLPVVTEVAKWFNDKLLPAVQGFFDWYGTRVAPLIEQTAKTAWPALKEAIKTVGSAFGDIFGAIDEFLIKSGVLRTIIIAVATLLAVDFPHALLITVQWLRVVVDAIIVSIAELVGLGQVIHDVMSGNIPKAVADAKASLSELGPHVKRLTESIKTAWTTTNQDMTQAEQEFARNFGLIYDSISGSSKRTNETIKANYQEMVTDQARKTALMKKNSQEMAEAPRKALEAERQATINAMRITLQGIADQIRNFVMPSVNAPGKPAGSGSGESGGTRTTHGAKAEGGYIPFAGTAFLHAGEFVLPAAMVQTIRGSASSGPPNGGTPSVMNGTVQIVIPVSIGNDKLATFIKEISLDQLANAFA